MGLRLVTTSDGAAALTTLRDLVLEAKGADPLAPVTVVVATNTAGVLARRHLGRTGGIAAVQFLTVYRLAELLGGPALARTGRRPVSTPVVTAAVQRALAEEPGAFAPVHVHDATVAAAVRGYRELRGLDPAAVALLGRRGTPLAAELVRLHGRVSRVLAGRWYDEADLLQAAAQAVGPPVAARLGPVVVHLPVRLTPPAARFLRRLAEELPVHVVLAHHGDLLADRAATRLADQLGLPAPEPAAAPPAPAVELVSASDADEEVRDAVRQLTDAARRGVPLERMAVLWTDPVPYRRLVGEHLEAAGLAWNGPSPIALAEHLAGRTLLGVLELDRFGLRRRDLFGLLGNAPVRDRSGHLVPAAAWERVARGAGVTRGDDWEIRLAEFARRQRSAAAVHTGEGEDARAVRALSDADAAEALAAFVAWLRAELGPPDAGRPWRDWARWSHRILRTLLGGEPVRVRFPAVERAAFDRVESAIDRLAELDELAAPPDRTAFRAAVTAALDAELLRAGRIGTGVLAGSLASAVGLDAAVTVVLGLAEGVVPAAPPGDPLLPDTDRRLVGLPVSEDHLADQRRALAAALASAGRVIASVPRGDLRRSCRRTPSRWLTELAGPAAISRTVHSYAAGVVGAEFPATATEHRVRSLLAHTRAGGEVDQHPLAVSDPALRHGLALLRARDLPVLTAYDGDLSGLPVPSPFHPDVVVSPTRLEAWVTCPHRYLIQYVLRVPEPEEPEQQLRISPLDRGNLIHETLDRFLTDVLDGALPAPAPHEPWTEAHARAALDILADECRTAERAGLTGRPLLWQRDRRLLERELVGWLCADSLERAAKGFTPAASERRFGRDGAPWPAPTVTLPSGRTVRFAGSIDRLDRRADGSYVVTDHKTGSLRSFAKLGPGAEFGDGSKLQLAVYAAAVAQATGTTPVGIEARYAFFRDHQRRGYTITDEVWQRFTEILDTIADGIHQGLFPARPAPPVYQPWVECHVCDPDGLGTGDLHRRWIAKQADPRLAPYLTLIGELEPQGGDDVALASP